MGKFVFKATLLLLLWCMGLSLHAQNKTVKIRQEKAMQGANEFILTWEGDSDKQAFYELKAVLESEPMVMRHVVLYQQHRISATVKEPWRYEQLKALFEAHGFSVVNKNNPGNDASDHH